MTFWKNSPHRMASYSFEVIFGDNTIWMAKSVDLPKFGVEVFTDLAGVQNIKTTGTATWEDVTIELYDIIGKNSVVAEGESPRPEADAVFDRLSELNVAKGGSSAFVIWATALDLKLEELGFDPNSTPMEVNYSLTNADGELGEVVIRKIYNNQEGKIEEWKLIDAVLAGFDMGSLDATSDETNTVKLQISYSSAEYKTTALDSRFNAKGIPIHQIPEE